MRKFLFFLFFFLIPYSLFAENKLKILFFYSPRCKACINLKDNFLIKVKEKYKDESLEWKEINVEEGDNLSVLISFSEEFKKKPVVPSIFIGDSFFSGGTEILENLEKKIDDLLIKKRIFNFKDFKKVNLFSFFKKLSFLTVLTSGLIDGINPCAFAVIVFFISFLTVYGYQKKQLIIVGVSYCLAVFLAYFLIGFGFFNFLYQLKELRYLIKIFYYFVAILCFLFSFYAFYDAFLYQKRRTTETQILQLPYFLKKRINLLIGKNLREKKEGFLMLVFSSFFTGILVSFLESACTGQIYLPTIVFILKNSDLKLKPLFYLFVYNLMFILPLLLVFLFAFVGMGSQRFNNFLKKNLGVIKFFMGLIFLILGIFILRIS